MTVYESTEKPTEPLLDSYMHKDSLGSWHRFCSSQVWQR